ncbi:MAG: hypothetical protein P9M03_04425 [Candidatus Theseobacter exili]|nr:hypothetical protein [Candidatus Theseobacter exili]
MTRKLSIWLVLLPILALPFMGFSCGGDSGKDTLNVSGTYLVDLSKMGDAVQRTWNITQNSSDVTVNSSAGFTFIGFIAGVQMKYERIYDDRDSGQTRYERGIIIFNKDNGSFQGSASVSAVDPETQNDVLLDEGAYSGVKIS